MNRRVTGFELIEHMRKYAEVHVGTESKPGDCPSGGYGLECFRSADGGMVTIVSNGLRDVEWFGGEVACSLHGEQAGYARKIVGEVCDFVGRGRKGLEYGQVIDHRGELFEGSRKEGLLAAAHPCFGEGFNRVSADSGVRIITVVPISRQEIDVAESNLASLRAHWVRVRPDLLDIGRPSTV